MTEQYLWGLLVASPSFFEFLANITRGYTMLQSFIQCRAEKKILQNQQQARGGMSYLSLWRPFSVQLLVYISSLGHPQYMFHPKTLLIILQAMFARRRPLLPSFLSLVTVTKVLRYFNVMIFSCRYIKDILPIRWSIFSTNGLFQTLQVINLDYKSFSQRIIYYCEPCKCDK